MNEEFEKHIKTVLMDWYDHFSERGWNATVNYVNDMQAKLDAKDKEMEALREYSDLCIKSGIRLISAQAYNLIDESGNPTPLLTSK
jgi:intergrase/recombinase